MTRTIALTRGKVALVDDADYDRVAEHKWNAVLIRGIWYARRGIGQDGKTHLQYLHHFVLNLPGAIRIDHRDHDGLNCTRGNIRFASAKENQWNVRIGRNNTSGYKGVTRAKGAFLAHITADGHVYHLGSFRDARLAALVRDAAARHFHGEFAWVNCPERDAVADAHFGRWLAGERNRKSRALLTTEQVQDIRRRYAKGGVLQRDLAAEYGVKTVTISHIITGRTWGDVQA